MTNVLLVDVDRCTGCRRCELACSLEKTGAFSISGSRIKVHVWEKSGECAPVVCMHCRVSEPPCMKACAPDAITRDPSSSAVIIDYGRCIQCGACVGACPFGAISLDLEGKPVKCDLYGGNPKCVKDCYPRALLWMTPGDVSGFVNEPFANGIRKLSIGPASTIGHESYPTSATEPKD